MLTALAFSLGALGRAHDVPVSALFRDEVEPDAARLRLPYRLALGAAVAALVGVAVGFSADHRLAAYYVAATLAVFVLLRARGLRVHGPGPRPAAAPPASRCGSRSPTSTGPAP